MVGMADVVRKEYVHRAWRILRTERDGRVSFEMLAPHNQHRAEIPVEAEALAGLAEIIKRALEGA